MLFLITHLLISIPFNLFRLFRKHLLLFSIITLHHSQKRMPSFFLLKNLLSILSRLRVWMSRMYAVGLLLLSLVMIFSKPVWSQGNETIALPLGDDVVTIQAPKYIEPLSSLIAPSITIDSQMIKQSQAQSVIELIRRLPGISIVQSGGVGQQSSLFIRGTESRHVLVLIDGIRLNQANISGASDLSQIPVSMIQKIEYIRGARSTLYGSDAIGGVINLITLPEERDVYLAKGSIDYGSFDTQRYDLSTQYAKDTFRVNGALGLNRSQGTDAVANMPEAGSIRQFDKDGFNNQFAWLGFANQFNSNLSANMRLYGIKNRNDYDGFFSYTSPYALIDERALDSQSIDSRVYWQGDVYAMQVIASHNRTHDYNFNDELGKHHPSASLDEARQTQVQMINTWRQKNGSINLGGQWVQQKTTQQPQDSGMITQSTLTNRAVYATTQYHLNELINEFAIRYDNQSQFGDHYTYHLGLSYPVFVDHTLSFMYGTAYKAPNLMQLYSQYGGNRFLQPEESQQIELGLSGQFGEVGYRATLYYNEIKELIDYRQQQYINIGKADITGSELELNWQGESIEHRLTLAQLSAKDKLTRERLLRRANFQLDYALGWQLDDAHILINYHFEEKRDDIKFNNDLFINQKVKLPVNQQIDFAVSYQIATDLIIRGRIADIFNQQRETVYGYQPTGRSFSIGGEYTF